MMKVCVNMSVLHALPSELKGRLQLASGRCAGLQYSTAGMRFSQAAL